MDETSPGRRPGKLKRKAYGTLLARVPQALVERVHAYARLHHVTVASLIREGVEWRITETKEDTHPPDLPLREDTRPSSIPPREGARPGIPPREDTRPPDMRI